MSNKALITGIGGQDGLFLSRILIEKGYEVHGITKSSDLGTLAHLEEDVRDKIELRVVNIAEKAPIDTLISEGQFDQVYHLAAQSSVARSINHPRETIESNVLGLTNIATSIRDKSPQTKLLFTGSSEMFGDLVDGQQSELTAPNPQSPYGLTKAFGFQLVNAYRKHYGLWAATAILFNHESEYRGEQFVTKKIIQSVVRIANGGDETLSLGNIHAQRDWGYAGDYMEGITQMMERESPDDYVFATGQLHSVKEFVEIAFNKVGIKLEWTGEGLAEEGRDTETQRTLVNIEKRFYRPGDIAGTCGDASKAREQLGWVPKTALDEFISKMIDHERANQSSKS